MWKDHQVFLLWARKIIHWRTHMGTNPSFFRFVKYVMRDSSKMSYTEHLLSSSISLKKKGVLSSHGGEKIKGSGSSFGKHNDSCWLSSLSMEPIWFLSRSWVICLSLSNTNTVSLHTPSSHPKSASVIIALCLVYLSLIQCCQAIFPPSQCSREVLT
jgi:hypothetical protein